MSSALIAVISRKLELSRAEKHVNNFMADSKLTNQRKNAAAAVLQQTWFIHKYKSSISRGKSEDLRLRHHQRRFLQAINEFRRIKWDQRKLQEKGNSLLDVGKVRHIYRLLSSYSEKLLTQLGYFLAMSASFPYRRQLEGKVEAGAASTWHRSRQWGLSV